MRSTGCLKITYKLLITVWVGIEKLASFGFSGSSALEKITQESVVYDQQSDSSGMHSWRVCIHRCRL